MQLSFYALLMTASAIRLMSFRQLVKAQITGEEILICQVMIAKNKVGKSPAIPFQSSFNKESNFQWRAFCSSHLAYRRGSNSTKFASLQ